MKDNTKFPCHVQSLDFEVHAPDRKYSIKVEEIADQHEPSRLCEEEFVDILTIWLLDRQEYFDVEFTRLNGKPTLHIKGMD